MIVSSPLPTALQAVLSGLEHAYEKEGFGGRSAPDLDQWSNLLRALDRTGEDLRRLPAILRISKRAVRTRISAAVRRGWVERVKPGRAEETVRLTSRAFEMAARWREIQRTAEGKWQVQVGQRVSAKLRASLEDLVRAFPLEHPHYPASYGVADASITGGNGVDWKPVPRTDASSFAGLPLSALVSQVMVAFAMQYEELSPVAFSLSTTLIRQISAEGRLSEGLGRSLGLSALMRHDFVRITGSGSRQMVFLSPSGLKVYRAYETCIHMVEDGWRQQFGDHTVSSLIGVLAEAGGGQAAHPIS